MKRWTAIAMMVFLPSALMAGTIANFKTPAEVREIISTAVAEWVLKPSEATGCGGGDCCPGATAPQCEAFALDVQLNPAPWAMRVAEQLQFDPDWVCNSWPKSGGSNETQTSCTTISGTPIIDVARILSEIADLRVAP